MDIAASWQRAWRRADRPGWGCRCSGLCVAARWRPSCEQLSSCCSSPRRGSCRQGGPSALWGWGSSRLGDTAGLDCSTRPSCSWEFNSCFALTDAYWALTLCWTLFLIAGLLIGSKVNKKACSHGVSVLTVEVGSIWWTRQVGCRWELWLGGGWGAACCH